MSDVKDLIARARNSVENHDAFVRNLPGWNSRLGHIYELISEMADALEQKDAGIHSGDEWFNLMAQRDDAVRELHSRELHHFETEKAMEQALDALSSPLDPTLVLDTHAGRALWKAHLADKAKEILTAALAEEAKGDG